MQSSENKAIIACAGSGKTTRLVREALDNRDRRIAIVTYTNFNAQEIRTKFGELNSGVPSHVDVMTWFGFLLHECARPYQRSKYSDRRIASIRFVNQQSAKYISETDTRRHYFASGDLIYSDKIAKFVVECEALSRGAVTARLSQIYTDVFIDEFQDLAGWDLEVTTQLLNSGIRVTLVGDPRQHIYSTNSSNKNKQFLGIKLINLVKQWQRDGLCSSEVMTGSYRCNRQICDFSNALWPGLETMEPLLSNRTDHDGVFLVAKGVVKAYIARFRPQVLHNDRSAEAYGCQALNFGLAKGLEFERVLIEPTGPIKKYLKSGDISHVEKARNKFYVAVTRARQSVAFVHDGSSAVVSNRWTTQ